MNQKTSGMTRRNFLQAAGIAAAGTMAAAAVVGTTGCSAAPDAKKPSYVPETWDKEVDIIIVGHGGAGAAAAITAVSEGLGDIAVLEAAPEGQDGGNTKVSMNLMLIPDDEEGIVTYQTALNGNHAVEEEFIRGWAKNIVENKTWLEDMGIEIKAMQAFSPEFPEIEGNEAVKTYCVEGTAGKNSLWNALKDQQDYLGYEVMYDTRAVELHRNPETNEALGVKAETSDGTVNIKARKGVILSCGGFENNEELCHAYLGLGQSKHPLGTPFNRGDGIKMVEPFGAQLWHMNNAAGATEAVFAGGLDSSQVASASFGVAQIPLHDYIFVGPDGKRFMYEETNYNTRHGKILQGGVFVDLPTPQGAWSIFGQTFFDNVPISAKSADLIGWASNYEVNVAEDNAGFLEKGVIVKADTVEQLAELIEVPADTLQKTIDTYNGYVEAQNDVDFKRGQAIYSQFSGMGSAKTASAGEETVAIEAFALQPIMAPFYATPLGGCIYNTQGGPKRNAEGQVLDVNNQPIGRLYGAGELGTVYSYMYNGGGNVSDAIASGRAAARHAGTLVAWDNES